MVRAHLSMAPGWPGHLQLETSGFMRARVRVDGRSTVMWPRGLRRRKQINMLSEDRSMKGKQQDIIKRQLGSETYTFKSAV